MNKFGVTIAIVAACIAATYAGPVLTPQMVDWSGVAAKMDEMKSGMHDAMDRVKMAANNDNAMVGNMIAAQCDAAMDMANTVFQQARMAVEQQTMTEGQAREMSGRLMGIMGNLKGKIEMHMHMLTPQVAMQIRMMFRDCMMMMEMKTEEMCAMLRMTGVQMVSWTDVAAKVGDIGALVRDTAEQMKMVAMNDNQMVGNTIGAKIDTAMMMARRIMDQANAAVENQSMTEDMARGWMGQMRAGMGKLMGMMQMDLNMLTPPAAVQIRQMFGMCFDSMDMMSEELYAMLRM